MDEMKRQALVLSLMQAMRASGSWCGETHIQKCAYFLQEGLGVPLDLEFLLYKHGPFSFDLRELIGELRGSLLVELKPQPYPYGPSLEVSDSGKRLIGFFSKTIAQYIDAIDFVASNLARRTVAELERIGTALYVGRQESGPSPEERAAQVVELKPHISPEQALTAVEEVDRLLSSVAPSGSTAGVAR